MTAQPTAARRHRYGRAWRAWLRTSCGMVHANEPGQRRRRPHRPQDGDRRDPDRPGRRPRIRPGGFSWRSLAKFDDPSIHVVYGSRFQNVNRYLFIWHWFCNRFLGAHYEIRYLHHFLGILLLNFLSNTLYRRAHHRRSDLLQGVPPRSVGQVRAEVHGLRVLSRSDGQSPQGRLPRSPKSRLRITRVRSKKARSSIGGMVLEQSSPLSSTASSTDAPRAIATSDQKGVSHLPADRRVHAR